MSGLLQSARHQQFLPTLKVEWLPSTIRQVPEVLSGSAAGVAAADKHIHKRLKWPLQQHSEC